MLRAFGWVFRGLQGLLGLLRVSLFFLRVLSEELLGAFGFLRLVVFCLQSFSGCYKGLLVSFLRLFRAFRRFQGFRVSRGPEIPWTPTHAFRNGGLRDALGIMTTPKRGPSIRELRTSRGTERISVGLKLFLCRSPAL